MRLDHSKQSKWHKERKGETEERDTHGDNCFFGIKEFQHQHLARRSG